jgi:cell division transport system permease protein
MRLKYVFSEVATGLWRNVTMTIAMIITMAVSLTLLGASLLLYKQVDTMRQVYNEEVESACSSRRRDDGGTEGRDRGRPPQRPAGGERRLRDQGRGYEKFKLLFASAPDLVNLTKSESLPESYRIKLKDTNTFDTFEAKYSKYVGDGGVEVIVDQKKLVEKVFTVLGALQKLALIIAIVQGVAALMLGDQHDPGRRVQQAP